MRIILIGLGTIGQSLLQLLHAQREQLLHTHGVNPRIVAAVDRAGAALAPQGLDLPRLLTVKAKQGSVSHHPSAGCPDMTALQVLDEVEAEVMIEATPTDLTTGEPALTHLRRALRLKKHVITSNKGPLALEFPGLHELAALNRVTLHYTATVGGGSRILPFAHSLSKGDRIRAVKGILNGTCNYILSVMAQNGSTLSDALHEAQRLGYAEADPRLDIDGWDTAAKLVIVANSVLSKPATLKEVQRTGIRDITPQEVQAAGERQAAIKLIGEANGDLRVRPVELPRRDPLCVDGALNAVTFTLQHAGDVTLIGPGVGGVETATAIIGDLIAIKEVLEREGES